MAASPIRLSNHLPERFLVEAQIRPKLLLPRGLIPRPAGFRRLCHFDAAVLGLRGIDRLNTKVERGSVRIQGDTAISHLFEDARNLKVSDMNRSEKRFTSHKIGIKPFPVLTASAAG